MNTKTDQTEFLNQYSFKNSKAYQKMEELACKLVVDNQDINLISNAKLFKDKAQLMIKENNTNCLKTHGLKEVTKNQVISKYDLRVQREKYLNILNHPLNKKGKLKNRRNSLLNQKNL